MTRVLAVKRLDGGLRHAGESSYQPPPLGEGCLSVLISQVPPDRPKVLTNIVD
jgi:hypothetical protein